MVKSILTNINDLKLSTMKFALPISVGEAYHEYPILDYTVGEIEKLKFAQSTVFLMDTLQQFNLRIEVPELTESEANTATKIAGRDWEKRNKSLLAKLQNCTIIHSTTLFENPNYANLKKWNENLYTNDKAFKKLVKTQIHVRLSEKFNLFEAGSEKGKETIEKNISSLPNYKQLTRENLEEKRSSIKKQMTENYKRAFELCKQYIIADCALTQLIGILGYDIMGYPRKMPNSVNHALDKFKEDTNIFDTLDIKDPKDFKLQVKKLNIPKQAVEEFSRSSNSQQISSPPRTTNHSPTFWNNSPPLYSAQSYPIQQQPSYPIQTSTTYPYPPQPFAYQAQPYQQFQSPYFQPPTFSYHQQVPQDLLSQSFSYQPQQHQQFLSPTSLGEPTQPKASSFLREQVSASQTQERDIANDLMLKLFEILNVQIPLMAASSPITAVSYASAMVETLRKIIPYIPQHPDLRLAFEMLFTCFSAVEKGLNLKAEPVVNAEHSSKTTISNEYQISSDFYEDINQLNKVPVSPTASPTLTCSPH